MTEKIIFEVGDTVRLKKPHPCGSKEWEVLRGYVAKKSTEMADRLHRGEIDDVPLLSREGRLACEYCEYQAVCGHEDDSLKRRESPGLPREEVLNRMREEQQK